MQGRRKIVPLQKKNQSIKMMDKRYHIDELSTTAKELIASMNGRKLYAFYGEMGSGKTTLIKALCREMGVEEEVNSPTFSIVNEYAGAADTIYHFDFYRINTPQEALDFGLYDYFDSERVCIMEWPECIEDLLPDEAVRINIEVVDVHTRRITMK